MTEAPLDEYVDICIEDIKKEAVYVSLTDPNGKVCFVPLHKGGFYRLYIDTISGDPPGLQCSWPTKGAA